MLRLSLVPQIHELTAAGSSDHGAFLLSSYLHRRGTTSRGYGSLRERASPTPSDGSVRGGCLFIKIHFVGILSSCVIGLIGCQGFQLTHQVFQSFHRTHSKRTTQSTWSSVHSPTSIRPQHKRPRHLMQRPS